MEFWWKTAGSCLLLLAGLGWGLERAGNLERRVWLLRGLGLGLNMLGTEISYGLTPLPQALLKAASNLEGTGGAALFRDCGERLRNGTGRVAAEAWAESLEDFCREEPSLDKVDREILQTLGGYLGLSDPRDQMKHLRLAQERLVFQEKAAREAAGRQGNVYRYAGFAMAAVLVLLFL